MNHTEIMTTHGYGRPLSEAQRSHLTGLIAAMNVAQIKLEAAQEVNTARLEAAQTAYNSTQAAAQSFLNYCGVELGCTFSDGDWQFDQQLMAFIRVPEAPLPEAVSVPSDSAIGAQGVPESEGQRVNGRVVPPPLRSHAGGGRDNEAI